MALADAYAQCGALLRERDPDRYWSALLAPGEARGALFAIGAFASEVARVREAVSAPMPGEIRLQWWRDALEGTARGEADANPVAAALLDAMERYRLPHGAFHDLIDARVFDLYDDPLPKLSDLEGYLGETSSALMRLASLILAGGHDPGFAGAAGEAGVAYGMTGLLRALPWHARQGRLFLPKDLLDRNGVTRDDVVLGRGGPGVVAIVAELREAAKAHGEAARRGLRDLPAALRPAFLPLALVPADLARLGRARDPLAIAPEQPAWRRIATLWWAAKRGF